jgi:hypothetical protein
MSDFLEIGKMKHIFVVDVFTMATASYLNGRYVTVASSFPASSEWNIVVL